MFVVCYTVRYLSSPGFNGKIIFDISKGDTGMNEVVTSSEDYKAIVVGFTVVGYHHLAYTSRSFTLSLGLPPSMPNDVAPITSACRLVRNGQLWSTTLLVRLPSILQPHKEICSQNDGVFQPQP